MQQIKVGYLRENLLTISCFFFSFFFSLEEHYGKRAAEKVVDRKQRGTAYAKSHPG